MAYRSRRPTSRSNRRYSSRARRYSGRSSRRSYGRRRSGGPQTLRLVLQQPGMQQPRPPFGSFIPTAFPGMAFGTGAGADPRSFVSEGAPTAAQGGPGVAGARMVINRPQRDPAQFVTPPGYRLVPDHTPQYEGGD